MKNLARHFLQTIPKSECTKFQPIWTALPEVIRTFIRFLGAKNPHRKYKGFRPMVKTLPYVFSHNFWTGRFQTKYDHFLKTRKIDLKHITRRSNYKKKVLTPTYGLKVVYQASHIPKIRKIYGLVAETCSKTHIFHTFFAIFGPKKFFLAKLPMPYSK